MSYPIHPITFSHFCFLFDFRDDDASVFGLNAARALFSQPSPRSSRARGVAEYDAVSSSRLWALCVSRYRNTRFSHVDDLDVRTKRRSRHGFPTRAIHPIRGDDDERERVRRGLEGRPKWFAAATDVFNGGFTVTPLEGRNRE